MEGVYFHPASSLIEALLPDDILLQILEFLLPQHLKQTALVSSLERMTGVGLSSVECSVLFGYSLETFLL